MRKKAVPRVKNTATMARAQNLAQTVATALHALHKRPNRKVRIPARALHSPDAIATIADRVQQPLCTHKDMMTMIHNHHVILKMISNHAPMPTWARKAASMPSVTSPAAALAVNPTRP